MNKSTSDVIRWRKGLEWTVKAKHGSSAVHQFSTGIEFCAISLYWIETGSDVMS